MGETLLGERFVLGELIDAGGMGEVFTAFDRRDARRVAVKRLRRDSARDPAFVARFEREGAILRAAAHPNIVQVLAVTEDDAGPCIVMEYVPGGTLEALLRRERRQPVERVLALALDLSDALARAHRLGVIHRDIKPANVLIADDGTPRLTDFGIATMGPVDVTSGRAEVMGTLPYLAPEQWDGERPDERADIWSFGVMLYEMLAGRRPFAADHLGMLLAAITLAEPPPLTSLRPDVPAPLARAIAAMLVKDPTRRMASVREVGLVAERLLRGAPTPTPMRVPIPATPLVGRTASLAALGSLVTNPAVRLVTLTGPGGSGKTRLALAAAHAAAPVFGDAVAFVDLTTATEPGQVLPAIARALDVEEDLQRSTEDLVAERLGTDRWLLVVDNFEQVIGAAPALAGLLSRATGTTALVTSRFLLRLEAECELPVAPLPPAEAAQLFEARARTADPSFAVTAVRAPAIAEICRRLDGLPLAIELAASRVRVLPVQTLLANLEGGLSLLTGGSADRAPHQRTLRRTIEWSVQLLEERERDLFVALATFAGGWSLEDAVALLAGERNLPEVVDGLQSLLEKSLIQRVESAGDPRYSMLETLREFAAGLLAQDARRDALAMRHARHFAALAEEWSEAIPTRQQAEMMQCFAESRANLHAAMEWMARHDPLQLPRLTAAQGRFWYFGGHWHEALAAGARALCEAAAPAGDRARVLDQMARLEMFLGDEAAALRHHEEAFALVVAEPGTRARLAEGLGEVLLKTGHQERALAVLHAAVPVAREAGRDGVLAEVLTTLATAHVAQGEHSVARELLGEALRLSTRTGDRHLLARIHYYLAGVALLAGDVAACRSHSETGRGFADESRDVAWACHLDEMLGRALVAEGRRDEARLLIDHSLHAFHAVGSRSCLPHSFEAAARVELSRGAEGARCAAWLLGAADRLCASLGIAMLPVERALLRQTSGQVREALGETFERACAEGGTASESDAVARAAAAVGG